MSGANYGRRSGKFQAMRRRVLEGSDICWLCGLPGATTVDHIVPLSVAPELGEEITNLAPAHAKCNYSRGNRTPARVAALPTSRTW